MARSKSKGALTRQRIIDAARSLMGSRPMEGLTVADIAAEAGMSKGSVYYHFDDLGQILDAAAVAELRGILASFERAATLATSAHDALLRIADAFIDLFGAGAPLSCVVSAPLRTAGEELADLRGRLHGLVAAQVARGKGEGSVRPDVDEDLAAAAITGVFTSMVLCRPQLCATAEGRRELHDQMLGFIVGGLGVSA